MSNGFRFDENPDEWAQWWIVMWAIISATLIALAFIMPFEAWAVCMALGFGVPEGIALLRKQDAYPPLTYVTRQYLPRWLTFTLLYGLIGTIGAFWFGFKHPGRIGALFGLLGWITTHFDVTYNDK